MKFTALEHLTHLDIRDNDIPELDIRPIRTIEYLNVERNAMTSLQVNGMQLKNMFAGHNGKITDWHQCRRFVHCMCHGHVKYVYFICKFHAIIDSVMIDFAVFCCSLGEICGHTQT